LRIASVVILLRRASNWHCTSNILCQQMKKQAREHRITILLNESEQRALDRFCERYKITNRSRLVRETLVRAILKKIENDQPTLFD